MDAKEELQKLIEIERKRLDAAIEKGLDRSIIFEQSHKLDDLISKFYNLE